MGEKNLYLLYSLHLQKDIKIIINSYFSKFFYNQIVGHNLQLIYLVTVH